MATLTSVLDLISDMRKQYITGNYNGHANYTLFCSSLSTFSIGASTCCKTQNVIKEAQLITLIPNNVGVV